jgi:CrcB protein
MDWLLVGVGGGLGAIARHGLNHLVRPYAQTFPLGIFLINVGGSVVVGVLAGLLASNRLTLSYEARMFVIVGILGGFTTFSSFSLDTLTLIRGGQMGLAAWNVLGQVGLSLIGVWLGFKLAS